MGSMRCFSQVINDLEMKDIPVQGVQFTWKGRLNNCRVARLDRFIVYEDWDCLFGGVNQSILPRPTSDHFPFFCLKGEGGLQALPLSNLGTCGLKRRGLRT